MSLERALTLEQLKVIRPLAAAGARILLRLADAGEAGAPAGDLMGDVLQISADQRSRTLAWLRAIGWLAPGGRLAIDAVTLRATAWRLRGLADADDLDACIAVPQLVITEPLDGTALARELSGTGARPSAFRTIDTFRHLASTATASFIIATPFLDEDGSNSSSRRQAALCGG